MRRIFLRLIVVGVVLSIFTGCATDAGRTKAEGTGFGALLGAALGAGIGAAIGGKNGALIGAGIGTAVGGGAGYVAGNAVAGKKQEYVNKEDRLDGQINSVVQCNNDLTNFNDQTASRIKDLDKEVSLLKSRYKTKKVRVSELTKKKDEINALISDGDQLKKNKTKEVIALNEYIKSLNRSQDRTKMAKLGQEVDLLRKSIAMLDSNNKQMAKLVKSLSVRK